ncbi:MULTISPECIES: CHY zinc finger protein [unclassified Haladaptatus]|uniref:CHY zinc finger protein n=1 Tax=unclassified Haladaptatus TaxID=2622732 RepID=UPI0023E8EE4A|nr:MULTISPECIES: CHY zinc finger protein [unclassified Haladaptatus]
MPDVRGVAVDAATRCAHYDSSLDVVALKFACCETYYPCFECHEAVADHPATVWLRDRFDEPAVLCGVCETELTVTEYLDAANECPACEAEFNPGCRAHHDRYFET